MSLFGLLKGRTLKNNLSVTIKIKYIMVIAIDFDGTCVTNEYPNVGKDIGAVPVLKRIVEKGHRIILYTMRDNNRLKDAEQWFESNNIPLWGVNNNPAQERWSSSPKIYAHLYIDDAALGVPLKLNKKISDTYFVDWEKVENFLRENGII